MRPLEGGRLLPLASIPLAPLARPPVRAGSYVPPVTSSAVVKGLASLLLDGTSLRVAYASTSPVPPCRLGV